jgi:magnesium-transporting ATPase (P-type)
MDAFETAEDVACKLRCPQMNAVQYLLYALSTHCARLISIAIQDLSPEDLVKFAKKHFQGNLLNFSKVFLSVLLPPNPVAHICIAYCHILWVVVQILGLQLSIKLNHAWRRHGQSPFLTQTFHTPLRAHLSFAANFGDLFVRIIRLSFHSLGTGKGHLASPWPK